MNDADDVYAISFRDGLHAADFVAALCDAVKAGAWQARERGADAPAPARVWIDSPLRPSGGEVCCVYVSAAALEAARSAGLEIPPSERVEDPDFPAGRILVLDAVAAG